MFLKLHYYLLWLRRIHLSRGFGVQSPFAYSFIRYVINEHYPYYGYAALKEKYPEGNFVEGKLGRLFFRIANYAQAETWLTNTLPNDMYVDYITAGCHHTKVLDASENIKERTVVSLSTINGYEELVENVLSKSNKHTILVIEDIYKNRSTRKYWKELLLDKRVIISFDLYYCGVLFFNTEYVKQDYIINF